MKDSVKYKEPATKTQRSLPEDIQYTGGTMIT